MPQKKTAGNGVSMRYPLVLLLTVVLAPWAALAQESPQAGAVVLSVSPTGDGRFDITGNALDMNDELACALVLASGKCMFSCGPGSLRCEGGTADLPLGEFALFDLPTEANGSIVLQVFVQDHISFTQQIDPNDP